MGPLTMATARFVRRNRLRRVSILLVMATGVCGVAWSPAPARADEVIHRLVTFTPNPAAFVTDASSVFVTYNSGVSATFLPARPQNRDRLLVHIKFVDAFGGRQYLVLRNLGKQYLDPTGYQQFQATLGLSAGTVSGGYTNGWILTDSVNGRVGNLVTSSASVTGSSTMPSPPVAANFNLRDGSLAIHELRVEFNFNTSYAPVFTDAGGLDRLTLQVRAEGMSVLSLPNVNLKTGPLHADGTGFDLDGDGRPDKGAIGIGLNESQHYRYQVAFVNTAGAYPFALMDVVPVDFAFDPDAERATTNCADGICDGVANDDTTRCSATISGPAGRRNTVDPRYVVLEGTGLAANQDCTFDVFAKTIPVSVKAKGMSVFAPTKCVTAQGASPSTLITRTIRLNEGVMLFDTTNQSLLGIFTNRGTDGPNPIELRPIGCQ